VRVIDSGVAGSDQGEPCCVELNMLGAKDSSCDVCDEPEPPYVETDCTDLDSGSEMLSRCGGRFMFVETPKFGIIFPGDIAGFCPTTAACTDPGWLGCRTVTCAQAGGCRQTGDT